MISFFKKIFVKKEDALFSDKLLNISDIEFICDGKGRIVWKKNKYEKEPGLNFNSTEFNLNGRGTFYSPELDVNFRVSVLEENDKCYYVLKNAASSAIRETAHDFNNIFSGILNGVENLKEKSLLEHTDLKILDLIENNSLRAIEILDDLLNGTAGGKLKTNIKTKVFLENLLENITFPKHKNINIQFRCENETPVYVNKLKLYRILLNILQNAFEAIERNGKVEVQIIQEDKFPDHSTIVIKDNGSGIPEDVLPQIFNLGFSTKEKKRDSGLGLAITKRLIEEEEGSVSVESKVGKGTTFFIRLPYKTEPLNGNKKRILVADDEMAVRELLVELLSDYNYEVLTARDGEEALSQYFNNEDISLVILDKQMPQIDGLQCAETIRKNSVNVPIVLASGSLGDDEKYIINNYKITRILKKPYKFDNLISIIQQLV